MYNYFDVEMISPNNPRESLTLFSCLQIRNRDSEKLSNLPKVTQHK